MNKLEKMFQYQHDLQQKLGTWDKIKNEADRQQFVNQMILAIHEEATEIMRETPYKNPDYVKFGWKKNQEWNNDKYKEEIIDLWHFVMNLAILVGMDGEEFYNVYCEKNNINHQRQKEGY